MRRREVEGGGGAVDEEQNQRIIGVTPKEPAQPIDQTPARREEAAMPHIRYVLLGLSAVAGAVAIAVMGFAGVHFGLDDVGAPVSASPRQA